MHHVLKMPIMNALGINRGANHSPFDEKKQSTISHKCNTPFFDDK